MKPLYSPVLLTPFLFILLAIGGPAGCDSNTNENQASPEKTHEDHEDHEKAEPQNAAADKGDDHGETVHLTEGQLDLLSIEVSTAGQGNAGAIVSAPATIRFDPDRTVRVGPRLTAKVVRVLVDLGDRVRKGEPLAVMDSVELGRAKATYFAAAAKLESAEATFEREQSLAKQKISSEAELLDAKAAYHQARADHDAAVATLELYGVDAGDISSVGGNEIPLSRFKLSAPAGGVVQARDLAPGQTVSPQETPIHIVDTSHVWVMIDAFEKSLPRLSTGLPVTFRSPVSPHQQYSGKTDWISNELDEKSRTVTVRAVVKNPDGALRGGMFGTADIDTGAYTNGGHTLVPVDAVQRIEDSDVVFVPAGERGAFRAKPVTLGNEGDGQVEIVEGLSPGAEVVVAGAFDLMSALTAASRSAAHSH